MNSPDPKNISEHGVLPLAEDAEAIEKELEAGLYTMASLPCDIEAVEVDMNLEGLSVVLVFRGTEPEMTCCC